MSPPPCGEGLGVGVGRSCKNVDALASPHDPHPTLPTRGRERRAASPRAHPLFFIVPTYGLRPYRPHGRLHGHGLNALGLDPARLILVETAHRKETLWAMEEAVRSAAPAAVVGVIDTLDLKLSQRLHLAATEAGLPAFFTAAGGDAGIRARRRRAGASAPRKPRATVSASSRSRAGICNSSAAATDGRVNG